MPDTVIQPGPAAENRLEIAPCTGRRLSLKLAADVSLEDAVANALKRNRLDGAWLELEGTAFESLNYVVPADSPDDEHVAWYSDVRTAEGPGTIAQLGMMVGQSNGASFLHGHGLWTTDQNTLRMGHILAGRTKLDKPVKARGIGWTGARFERQADHETNFDLFRPVVLHKAGNVDFALLRIAPNEDLATSIDLACCKLGWLSAKAHGLGSIFNPSFSHGGKLESLASEFLILSAEAEAQGAVQLPDIALVGMDETTVWHGDITRGDNPILITAEIVLERTG